MKIRRTVHCWVLGLSAALLAGCGATYEADQQRQPPTQSNGNAPPTSASYHQLYRDFAPFAGFSPRIHRSMPQIRQMGASQCLLEYTGPPDTAAEQNHYRRCMFQFGYLPYGY